MTHPARIVVTSPPATQRGGVLVLFVVGMVAILAVAGLALDGGHSMLSKSRLQNAVDAAALHSAKLLNDSGDEALAEAAAFGMFAANANGAGNSEMARAYADGSLSVTVEFSATLNPFLPGTTPAEYVRVRAENFTLPAWFVSIVGVAEKRVAASAVAGPSPTIDYACNLMPMMVCGDPSAGGPYWGYEVGQPQVLKSSTTSGQWEVGPGNFQLIQLGGSGANVVRHAMAGSYAGCLARDDVIDTQPGNEVGPVAQGLNTRFGRYQGPMSGMQSTYPPDVVTEQPFPALTYNSTTGAIMQGGAVVTDSGDLDFSYQDYVDRRDGLNHDYAPAPEGIGAYNRREAAVAIGDCSGSNSGQSQIPLLGFGCFFLLQEVSQQGNQSHVYGEFIQDCQTGGMPGPEPNDGEGPYIIQLYRDFSSNDS
jgi:hypothetical protein